MVFRVVLAGKIIHIVSALLLGHAAGQNIHALLAGGALVAGPQPGTQSLQKPLPLRLQCGRHHQRERMAAAPGGNGQRRRKGAAAGLHNGLAFLQFAPLGDQTDHGGGQRILAGAGGAVEQQAGVQLAGEAVFCGIAAKGHHRAAGELLVIGLVDSGHHKRLPFLLYIGKHRKRMRRIRAAYPPLSAFIVARSAAKVMPGKKERFLHRFPLDSAARPLL